MQTQFKAVVKRQITARTAEFTVIEFYKHASLGECHVRYVDVICSTPAEAIEHVTQ